MRRQHHRACSRVSPLYRCLGLTLLVSGLTGVCIGSASAWEAKYEIPEKGLRVYGDGGNYKVVADANARLVTWCYFDKKGTFQQRLVFYEHLLVVERWPSLGTGYSLQYRRPLKPLWPLKPQKSVVNSFNQKLPTGHVLKAKSRFTVGRRRSIEINGEVYAAIIIRGEQIRYYKGKRVDTLIVERAYLLAHKITVVLSVSDGDPAKAVEYPRIIGIERPKPGRSPTSDMQDCLSKTS